MKTAEGSEEDVEQENQQGRVGEGELSVYLRLEAGDKVRLFREIFASIQYKHGQETQRRNRGLH